jgi:hypothetical protein
MPLLVVLALSVPIGGGEPPQGAVSVPLASLGSLLKGRVLVNFVKEGMTPEQVKAILGPYLLSAGDAYGFDWWYPDYGVTVFFLREQAPGRPLGDRFTVRDTHWTCRWPW